MDSGFILIDKPKGITSHQAVDRLRAITGIRKIGHAGTLDPLAEGLMIMAVGRDATRRISVFVKLDKEYEASIRLGARTRSYDLETEPEITSNDLSAIDIKKIEQVLAGFIGRQKQLPPMHSAKKINGKKLYTYARTGREIERRPSDIEIFALGIIKFAKPQLEVCAQVSSGTYIRTLANDLGERLGVGAYLSDLRRTRIGAYSLNEAVKLDDLDADGWKNRIFQLDSL